MPHRYCIMSEYIINGGRPLRGSIVPQGSKNAALPIIFACIAVDGISVIENLPNIGDVRCALKLVEGFGASVKRSADTVEIDTSSLSYSPPDKDLVSSLRASTYLLGACLARFGIFHISNFGGCNFCNRPIDLHVYAAECLGATVTDGIARVHRLSGGRIDFPKRSVGATLNALIMASAAEGISEIRGFARESHVMCAVDFLRSAGADINVGADVITVRGRSLACGRVRVIPDMIEAGTYIAAALATGGRISVACDDISELIPFLDVIASSGATVCVSDNVVTAEGRISAPLNVITAPYPGYPTDLQPQLAPLMALAKGGSLEERVWQNRFSYLAELAQFGIRYSVNGNRAIVYPSQIYPSACTAPDLRGGAAAVISALAAEGMSVIKNAECIMRGYSRLESKLAALGADVNFIKGDT